MHSLTQNSYFSSGKCLRFYDSIFRMMMDNLMIKGSVTKSASYAKVAVYLKELEKRSN